MKVSSWMNVITPKRWGARLSKANNHTFKQDHTSWTFPNTSRRVIASWRRGLEKSITFNHSESWVMWTRFPSTRQENHGLQNATYCNKIVFVNRCRHVFTDADNDLATGWPDLSSVITRNWVIARLSLVREAEKGCTQFGGADHVSWTRPCQYWNLVDVMCTMLVTKMLDAYKLLGIFFHNSFIGFSKHQCWGTSIDPKLRWVPDPISPTRHYQKAPQYAH